MDEDIKKLFYTLTRAQQAIWARAVKAGWNPTYHEDKRGKRLDKKHCPTCRRVGLLYDKPTKEGHVRYLACSNGHFTKLGA